MPHCASTLNSQESVWPDVTDVEFSDCHCMMISWNVTASFISQISSTTTVMLVNKSDINRYKNIKRKLKCCADLYFNKQCLKCDLIPKYTKIHVPHTSPAGQARSIKFDMIVNLYSQLYMHQNLCTSGISKSPTCFGTSWVSSSGSPFSS